MAVEEEALVGFRGGLAARRNPTEFGDEQWAKLLGFIIEDGGVMRTQWPLQEVSELSDVAALGVYQGSGESPFLVAVTDDGSIYWREAPVESVDSADATLSESWHGMLDESGVELTGANAPDAGLRPICSVPLDAAQLSESTGGLRPALMLNSRTVTDSGDVWFIYEADSPSTEAETLRAMTLGSSAMWPVDDETEASPKAEHGCLWSGVLVLGDIEWKADPDVALSSSNKTAYRNGLWLSVAGEPLLFDPLSVLFIGEANTRISGLQETDQGLLVFTTSTEGIGGVHILRGTPDAFTLEPLHVGIGVTEGQSNWQDTNTFSWVTDAGEVWQPLALDTPVPTPKGWTTIGDVNVGDDVIGRDGRAAQVTGLSPTYGNRECYRLTFADGTSVVSDREHRWAVIDRRRHRLGEVVHTTAELAEEVRLEGDRPGWRWAVPQSEPLDLKPADLPIDPYVFGYWLGDGNSRAARITCGDEDREHIVRELEDAGHEVIRQTRDKTAWDIGFSGAHGVLKEMGVFQNKHIPALFLRGSFAQRLALLQGLMDADGYVSPRKTATRCAFYNTNGTLVEGVLELLRTLGLRPANRLYKNDRYTSGQIGILDFEAPREFVPFRLPRKVSKCPVGKKTARQRYKSIVSIDRVESVPVRCLEVDASDHLFLVGEGFTATHNTDTQDVKRLDRQGLGVDRQRSARDGVKSFGPWLLAVRERRMFALRALDDGRTAAWTELDVSALDGPPDMRFAHETGQVLYFLAGGTVYRFTRADIETGNSERGVVPGGTANLAVGTRTLATGQGHQKTFWHRVGIRATAGRRGTSASIDRVILRAGPVLDSQSPLLTREGPWDLAVAEADLEGLQYDPVEWGGELVVWGGSEVTWDIVPQDLLPVPTHSPKRWQAIVRGTGAANEFSAEVQCSGDVQIEQLSVFYQGSIRGGDEEGR